MYLPGNFYPNYYQPPCQKRMLATFICCLKASIHQQTASLKRGDISACGLEEKMIKWN